MVPLHTPIMVKGFGNMPCGIQQNLSTYKFTNYAQELVLCRFEF
jgi:hypothetical protein